MLQALTVRVNIVGELGMFLCRKLTSNQCRSKDLKKTAFFVGGGILLQSKYGNILRLYKSNKHRIRQILKQRTIS